MGTGSMGTGTGTTTGTGTDRGTGSPGGHPEAAVVVTVGVPVRNGGRYLDEALAALRSQTFRDFEVVISDNASTDDTADICRRHAADDLRIAYHRNDRDRGAVHNFNRCLELARGRYFTWKAHDDLVAPTFLARCVARLEDEPDAVLCHTRTHIVDADGRVLGVYDPATLGTDADRPSSRFGARVVAPHCVEVFGVIRTDALRRVRPLQPFVGSDRAVLAELALEGRFVTVDEPLFHNRKHPDRSTRFGLRPLERLAFHRPVQPGDRSHPVWSLYAAYVEMLRRRVPGSAARLPYLGHLVRALFVRHNWLRLVLEPFGAVAPWLWDVAATVRRRAGRTGYPGRGGD